VAAPKKTAEKKPEPEVEVAKRSADGSDGDKHVKEFVVLGDTLTEDGPGHDPNRAAVLQEAIQRGLHPRGDVTFDGTEILDDGVSRVLRYSVTVVPASVDAEPEKTTTPRDQVEGGD
jgi:hypothetical protein